MDHFEGCLKGIVIAILLPLLFPASGAKTRQSDSQQERLNPPRVYVDEGACPFEGCVYRQWTARQDITLFDRPDGKVVGALKKGDRVQGLTGIVRTVPNRVRVVYNHKGYKAGDVFFILTYIGEGFAKVWFQGEIREEDITALPLEGFHHPKPRPLNCKIPDAKCWWNVESPKRQSTWWVKIKTTTGLVAWTISSGNFDNQDALG